MKKEPGPQDALVEETEEYEQAVQYANGVGGAGRDDILTKIKEKDNKKG